MVFNIRVISFIPLFIIHLLGNAEKSANYGCAMRGVCGKDGDLYQNCIYNGPPIPINRTHEAEFVELCPRLFKGFDFIPKVDSIFDF
jgi:hypothetical protein